MEEKNKYKNKPVEQPDLNDHQEEKSSSKKVKREATQEQLDHPLHGVKLKDILERLVEHYGWEYLAYEVNIKCFKYNPSIKVSLKFLRKFKWAQEHVKDIYVRMVENGFDPVESKRKK